MSQRVRDLVQDWRSDDADKLAVLENEAAVAWPGGGGWQATPAEIERWFRDTEHIGVFVVEDGDRFVSICSLLADPGQKEDSYIPHLNCHPDYHGKGYGKTVLLAAVESGYRNGFRKVDLNTWAANMRAVPLYKKSGFMWKPDTTVFMENFIPSARRHPLGKEFFRQHSWYDTLERTLDLKEDLAKLGKVRVYEYRWRAENGDFLRMLFDSQSWRPVEIENNELLVSCRVADEKLVAGVEHPVKWQVANKRSKPVQVALSAGGDQGVLARKQELLELTRRARIEGSFTIDPEIPEKKRDPKVALLTTSLSVGGQELELSAGIRVQQAVEISLSPTRAIVTPGTPQPVMLSLSSNLEEDATVHLSVAPQQNATIRKRQHKVLLGARRGAELELVVAAPTAGHVALEIRAHAVAGRLKIPIVKKCLDLLAVQPGGTAAAAGLDHGLLTSGGLMLTASLRNGTVEVYHRLRAQRAHRLSLYAPSFGPPFSWEDLFLEKGEGAADGDAIRLRAHSVLRPGVILDRRIRILHGVIIEIVDSVINGSARPLQLSRMMGWEMESSYCQKLWIGRPANPGVDGRKEESVSSG